MEGIKDAKGSEWQFKRCYQRARTAEALLASVYEQLLGVPHGSKTGLPRIKSEEPNDVSDQPTLLRIGG